MTDAEAALDDVVTNDNLTTDLDDAVGNLETDRQQAPDDTRDLVEGYEDALSQASVDSNNLDPVDLDAVKEKREPLSKACEITSDAPDEPKAPSLSKSEKKWVKEQVYSEPGDDEYADEVASALKSGHKTCDKIGDHDAGWSRTRYLYDREMNESDAYDAVKYLCTKFEDDVKLAKRTIPEDSDGDVDDDIKPGTYASVSGISDCYWERQTGGGDIIANNFVTHASKGITVTIRSSDGGFSTNGCGPLYPTGKP